MAAATAGAARTRGLTGGYPPSMIVVIGSPVGRLVAGSVSAAGTASLVALAAARAGRTVQLVGRTGDDATADSLILDLARGGVGHVALLRDPARTTPLEVAPDADAADGPLDGDPESEMEVPRGGPTLDAADVDLGLRYLTDFDVVVLAEIDGPGIVAVVGEAARWADARPLIIVGAGDAVPDGLPPDAIVFEAPEADPDGAFASLVGSFAAALDDGADPAEALQTTIASEGWTGSSED